MTLYDVWNPIRTNIASEIKSSVNAITNLNLSTPDSEKIETLCYNYCHTLMSCDMMFDNESTTAELQTILKQVFRHKAYALVSEWNLVCSAMQVDSGKSVSQDSFYDVADTPRMEHKEFNELDIRSRQIDNLYNHSQAIKELYNEIKSLVQTIY